MKLTAGISSAAILATTLALTSGQAYAATKTVCNSGCDYTTIQDAVAGASSGDTISVASGTYDLTSELDITKSLSIVGSGTVTIHSNNAAWGTSSTNKHIIDIEAGTSTSPVTLSNLVIDSNGQSYGVNTYDDAYAELDGVTIENSKGAGLTVNGSTVIADGLTTTGNSWGAVNVDPGSGVTTPSVFTLNSGTLAESTQIWSDGSHVSGSATVTVNAPGYDQYKVGGTTAGYFWTNQALTDAATITTGGVTTYYTSIPAALAAASSGDTVVVAPGTYSNVSLTGSYASDVTVEGSGQPTIDGLDLTGSTFDGLTFKDLTFTGDSAGYGDFSVTIAGDGTYSGLKFSDDTFDGQSQNGRGAIFLNRGFDGFTLQYDAFENYVSTNAGDVYSIVFAEAQGASMGDNYTASGNTLTNANAVNFLEAYRWQNVTYQNNTVNTNSYGRLLVWSDDSESLGTVNITGNTVNVAAGKGIGVYYAPNTTVNVTGGNAVDGADICLILDSVSDSTVTGNNFSNCSTGVQFSQDGATTLDSASVTDNIFTNDTVNIQKTAAITDYVSDAAVSLPVSGNQSTTSGDVTLNGSTSDGTATVSIPSGTTITASGTWDGTLNPPTVTSVSIPGTSGYTTTTGMAISVGSDSVTLTFDQPVRLVLPGQAGKHVGFVEPGGSFTKITTECDGDTQADADAQLSAGEACYINVGSDLVVWTTHFSTFATYTLTPKSSGGGGSSGSSTGSGSSISSNTVTSSGTQGAASIFGSGIGQVLGTSTTTPGSNGGSNKGQVKGSNTTANAQNQNDNGGKSNFLGLGWWWLLVLALLALIIGGLLRRTDGTDKSS